MEVPLNIEAQQIFSPSSTLPSYLSNAALLKDDPKFLLFSGYWQSLCKYDSHDLGHHPNEGYS